MKRQTNCDSKGISLKTNSCSLKILSKRKNQISNKIRWVFCRNQMSIKSTETVGSDFLQKETFLFFTQKRRSRIQIKVCVNRKSVLSLSCNPIQYIPRF